MYRTDLSIYQCIILAAYVLFQVKEHVDGCGGESHIAVLRHEGRSGLVDQTRVREITEVAKYADGRFAETLLSAADLWIDKGVFVEKLRDASELIQDFRDQALDTISTSDEWSRGLILNDTDGSGAGSIDPLGFLMPSGSQNSEKQP